MGYDHNAKLFVGWMIDFRKLRAWASELKLKERGCYGDDGWCGCCDNEFAKEHLPAGFVIDSAPPFGGCEPEDYNYFLMLDGLVVRFEWSEVSLSKLLSIDRTVFEDAKEFAKCLGATESEPMVKAVPLIW